MDVSRFNYLLEQYKSGHLSAVEREELLRFTDEGNEQHWGDILDPWMSEKAGQAENLSREFIAGELALILLADKQKGGVVRTMVPQRRHFMRRWGWVAAILVGLLATGTWYFINQGDKTASPSRIVLPDIQPGSAKAVLTLADGSSITLDSSGNQVIQQGLAAVHQLNGSLQYEANGRESGISYNQLSTPKQGQFQVVLADGTKVWLNAASSLRYPTVFTGKERMVEVTGEAYFEVAVNAAQPFIVKVNHTMIQVLGTSFNVNAYADEQYLNTTLLSGSVKVQTQRESTLLTPGKMAAVTADGSTTMSTANIKVVMAWKNGLFCFENADIKTVMRQLSRWYNITIEFRGDIPPITFSGEIERSLTLSQVLMGLGSNELHYTLEKGNKLVIQP
ncbi:MAG: FecR domain-containing protein [Chitinophaga sp.]|uniref:FecR family protein n=1 Tax=Chitinophaga sp. TaxID=1869181 RepID=UPI001B103FB8|nr:FecR family protein [Chitinophaga sp.]MBO9732417.1 FecR domain-containing protein [Chitinophaga sp.]